MKENLPSQMPDFGNKKDEVDVFELLAYLGRGIRKAIRKTKELIVFVLTQLAELILFTKKKMLILAVFVAIFTSYPLIKFFLADNKTIIQKEFHSEAVIELNFKTAKTLHHQFEMFEEQMGKGDYASLANTLGMSESEVKKFQEFKIYPKVDFEESIEAVTRHIQDFSTLGLLKEKKKQGKEETSLMYGLVSEQLQRDWTEEGVEKLPFFENFRYYMVQIKTNSKMGLAGLAPKLIQILERDMYFKNQQKKALYNLEKKKGLLEREYSLLEKTILGLSTNSDGEQSKTILVANSNATKMELLHDQLEKKGEQIIATEEAIQRKQKIARVSQSFGKVGLEEKETSIVKSIPIFRFMLLGLIAFYGWFFLVRVNRELNNFENRKQN